MDSFMFFVMCITSSALVYGDGNKASTNISCESESFNVTVGQTFTMNCTVETHNTSCVWTRNETAVKNDENRYSFQTITNTTGKTYCSIRVHNAGCMDMGNWTCSTKATDYNDGQRSKNISVIVLSRINGTQCTDAEINKKDENAGSTRAPDKNAQRGNLYIYIGCGVSGAIILSLILIIALLLRGKMETNKDQENKKKSCPINPIYEEIVEYPDRLSAIGELVQPSTSTIQVCPRPPPKANKKHNSVKIREIVDWEGYQVPLKQDGALLIRDGFLIQRPKAAENSPRAHRDIELTSMSRMLPEPLDETPNKVTKYVHQSKKESKSQGNQGKSRNTKFHTYENVNPSLLDVKS